MAAIVLYRGQRVEPAGYNDRVMSNHPHWIRLALAATALATLAAAAGCGNKGALYLPDPPAAETGAGESNADDEDGEDG